MISSVFDFDKNEVLDALRVQRAHTLALLEDLSDEQWEVEVVPRWRSREVAAHLITTDAASLTGKYLTWGFSRRPMTDIERWNDEQVATWADRPVPSLLHALDRWGRRWARAASLPPRRVASVRIPTPFGRVSLLWLEMLRVYDEWVHVEDIRRALQMPADDRAATLAPAARFLLAGIPIQTLPDLKDDGSGTISIGFTDVDAGRLWVDLGSRRFGSDPAKEDAAIEGPAAALIMVAAGRDPWQEAEAGGKILIRGDRGPAEKFLEALRVV
ncbi:MAG: maleylpyruvate isomerase family mycothiol-dependent enzyme [Actinomycetota bacterium]